MFPSKFDYVAATTLDEAISAKAEGGDETQVPRRWPEPAADDEDPSGQSGQAGGHQPVDRPRHDRAVQRASARSGRSCVTPRWRPRTRCSACWPRPHPGWPTRWCATSARSAARSPIATPRATGTPCCWRPAPTWWPRVPAASAPSRSPSSCRACSPTRLADDEMLVEIRVPVPTGRSGGAYLKLERKVGDYATVAVAAQLGLGDGRLHLPGRHRPHLGQRHQHQGDRGRGPARWARPPATSCSPTPAELAACGGRSPLRRAGHRGMEAPGRPHLHPSSAGHAASQAQGS